MTINVSVSTVNEAALVSVSRNSNHNDTSGLRRVGHWHGSESSEIVPPNSSASFGLTGGANLRITPLPQGVNSWEDFDCQNGPSAASPGSGRAPQPTAAEPEQEQAFQDAHRGDPEQSSDAA